MSRATEHVQAVVIGGGVVGCALARELARRDVEVLLLEAEPDVGEGASKANSGIVHTGFDARPGSIEAAMLRRAAALWPETIEALRVPFLEVGALMLAMTSADRDRLQAEVAETAASHGVATELVDGTALRELAPYVTDRAVAALHIPGEGVIDPFWLTRAYAEAAIGLGARVWTGARVTAVEVTPDEVLVTVADGRVVVAAQAFDAAGVGADAVAASAGDETFRIGARKGQFLVSEKTFGVDRIVLPIPGPLGKGMLVTPIVFGGVLLGPTAEDVDDKTDRATDAEGTERILRACRDLVPDVAGMEPIRRFAGIRPVSSTGDYIVRPSAAGDRLTIVAGIRSTGVSASPAVAELAADLALEARGWRASHRSAAPAPEPAWSSETGGIVCVCRSVSAAEVDAALGGPLPATTADGVKRRAGAGFGDCQGNACLAEVAHRIAAASGLPITGVCRGPSGSWIVAGDARASARSADALPGGARLPAGTVPDVDLVVVGAGLAGIGAAVVAAESGLRVLVIDRRARPGGTLGRLAASVLEAPEARAIDGFRERVRQGSIDWMPAGTAVGLREAGDGWIVEVELEGSQEVRAAQVLLATGGYVVPREQLAVPGPRLSGIVTADFVHDALDRGWLPGTRAVVVGSGRVARGTVERLEESGVTVVASVTAGGGMEVPGLGGVRGQGRLSGVLVDRAWHEADTLVLAHALRPATFLLRGLGIGDERPGVAAPADADGRLALPGLWAAGTCRTPDVDHAGSLADGASVGAAMAAAARSGAAAR